MYQNLCFKQREFLREILAICAQEHMEHLDAGDKLKRIELYARRALATK